MKIQNWFYIITFILILFSRAEGQSIETVVQAGHYAAVTAVCYSSDGRFITTGSADKTIILWRKSDGKQIRSFRGSSSPIDYVVRKSTAICRNQKSGAWSFYLCSS
jgi:WD40 repeat protein